MRLQSRSLRISLTTILVGTSLLLASGKTQAQRGADATMRTFVPGIDVLPLPGMPFSATETIVWTRPLDGGGTVTSYLKANVFRDSQGRLYRERQHFSADQYADPRTTLYEFYIDDPTTRTRTTCTLRTHICQVTRYWPPRELPLQPPGPFDQGRRTLTREPLGNQTLNDLPVVGTRETVVVSPGTIGNDTPVTLSREFWYSEDLKTNLSVARKDPREGNQTITFTTLSRNEPDPRTFALPAGYTVTDARHPTTTSPN
jgi:hypothetical protein